MNICIRVDSSSQLGTGHVMRCLTLADELREHGAQVIFICRVLPGDLTAYISEKDYRVHRITAHNLESTLDYASDISETSEIIKQLQVPIDWLIIDHYQIDSNWELQLRPLVNQIMVIDDLANREHACDVILDQNFFEQLDQRYDKLVPNYCIRLLGPSFALLRKEFKEARRKLRARDGEVRKLFVFFGGSDPTHETEKVLMALRILDMEQCEVDVVVGTSNQRREVIEEMCDSMRNVNYHCQITHMASLMASADLAIGAGGTATWERMYLGLPTITIIIADNQEEMTTALSHENLICNLGHYESVSVEMIADEVQNFMSNANRIRDMERNALSFMDRDSNENISYVTKLLFGESGSHAN